MAKFREMGQPQAGGRIGTVLNLTPTYAASDAEADQEQPELPNCGTIKCFSTQPSKEFPVELLELLTKDGVLWQSTADELALIKKYC